MIQPYDDRILVKPDPETHEPGINAGIILNWRTGQRWIINGGSSGAGRVEAFRVSIRELIEKATAFDAYPSQWAPFVVVGDGVR